MGDFTTHADEEGDRITLHDVSKEMAAEIFREVKWEETEDFSVARLKVGKVEIRLFT